MEEILIDTLVSESIAEQWLAELGASEWVDARMTAGRWARPAKKSRAAHGVVGARVQQSILEIMVGDSRVSSVALPHRITQPTLLKYEAGDRYGSHEDNAMQGNMRADLSYTVWLSGPSDYEGGELCIGEHAHQTAYRPAAGTVLLYTSGRPHEVRYVTSGARVVAVGWIQSLVRDAGCRDLLITMDRALAALLDRAGEISTELALLNRVRNELLRRWAEP